MMNWSRKSHSFDDVLNITKICFIDRCASLQYSIIFFVDRNHNNAYFQYPKCFLDLMMKYIGKTIEVKNTWADYGLSTFLGFVIRFDKENICLQRKQLQKTNFQTSYSTQWIILSKCKTDNVIESNCTKS